MKKQALTLITTLLFAASSFAKTFPDLKSQLRTGINFTENKGQVHDQNHKSRPDVLYSTMTGNLAVHIKNTGVSYQLYRVDAYKTDLASLADKDPTKKRKEIDQQTIYRIDLNWLNFNPNFTKTEDEALKSFTNYYLENCPDGIVNIKSYKGITLNNLYNGINLHYYEKNGELKHDYIVAAHSDYKKIQVQVEGADISVNEDGSLTLTTPLGHVQEGTPIVYQNAKKLNARWQVRNNILSFEIDNYNPDMELIIDPVTRLWGTFYGGGPSGSGGIDYGYSCTTDITGSVYMTGETGASSTNVIATSGSHQSAIGGGYDAFLVKFDAGGIRQWGTYYGDSGNDVGTSCTFDATGNIYMCGNTGSSGNGYPVISTFGSHQFYFGGGWDAFLVKFDFNGIRQWGTYYGGTEDDKSTSCALDANGNIFMTGYTSSGTGSTIATFLSHDYYFSGGSQYFNSDAFLVKFNASGVRQWGTYYGGTEDDWSYSCATDTSGNIYITGTTESSGVIATSGSHQSQAVGNFFSISFLAKFNSGGVRQWGTYYSGTADSEGYSCATDLAGNVYMGGYTQSTIPANVTISTPGSHQSVYGGGSYDAFLVKFNSGGVRQWGTYYGGTDSDYGNCCTTDALGNVYLSGYTASYTGTAIATSDSHQPTFAGGTDAFLAKFNANGIRQWGTYYGGNGNEYGYSCAADNMGSVFMTGCTSTFYNDPSIATSTSHQPTYGGGSYDAYLVKFDVCNTPVQPSAISGNTIACIGQEAGTYSIEVMEEAIDYTWTLPADWSGSSNTNEILATPGTSGIFTVTANNTCGTSLSQTLSITVSDCTGIQENTATTFGIKLYPNPTKGMVYLELNLDYEIIILNSMGEIVYSSKLNSGKREISLENLTKGIYLVKLSNGVSSKNLKIVKE